MTILSVTNARVVLGGVIAVDEASLSVEKGEIVGLIGPNGAGKTTLINAITGYVRLTRGNVQLHAREVSGWRPDRLVRAGLTRTFQGARLFDSMTVLENVEVAAMAKHGRRRARVIARNTLNELGLGHLGQAQAGAQAAGEQRLLGLARALATEPDLLLLDEPAAGLNEDESSELTENLKALRVQKNISMIVVEHDMSLIRRLCDKITVLDSGKVIADGRPEEVMSSSRVIEAYLGKEAVNLDTEMFLLEASQ